MAILIPLGVPEKKLWIIFLSRLVRRGRQNKLNHIFNSDEMGNYNCQLSICFRLDKVCTRGPATLHFIHRALWIKASVDTNMMCVYLCIYVYIDMRMGTRLLTCFVHRHAFSCGLANWRAVLVGPAFGWQLSQRHALAASWIFTVPPSLLCIPFLVTTSQPGCVTHMSRKYPTQTPGPHPSGWHFTLMPRTNAYLVACPTFGY